MNGRTLLTTLDVLREFGFVPDATVMSDPMPGPSFDFDNFKLTASRLFNLNFQAVVLFGGVVAAPRSLAEISFEMPILVESVEQCAAFL